MTVMHPHHLNLCASDVHGLAETLEAHFGFRILDSGSAPGSDGTPGTGPSFALVVGHGCEIVITQIDPVADGGSAYPRGFHFGLLQDSRDAVYAKHDELVTAGFEPGRISDGFEVWGATWTAFYCPLGDGLEVEINYRTSSEMLDDASTTFDAADRAAAAQG